MEHEILTQLAQEVALAEEQASRHSNLAERKATQDRRGRLASCALGVVTFIVVASEKAGTLGLGLLGATAFMLLFLCGVRWAEDARTHDVHAVSWNNLRRGLARLLADLEDGRTTSEAARAFTGWMRLKDVLPRVPSNNKVSRSLNAKAGDR